MQYVTSWHIEIAKQLLCNPKNTLAYAAEGAGYASDSAFSRVFKKETGMTPATFKNAAPTSLSSIFLLQAREFCPLKFCLVIDKTGGFGLAFSY